MSHVMLAWRPLPRFTCRRLGSTLYVWLLPLLILSGCSSQHHSAPSEPASVVKARTLRLLPPGVSDRNGWAEDITQSFSHQGLPASVTNLCAVIAVAGQESGFQTNPVIPGLPNMAMKEIYRRAGEHYIPQFVVNQALKIPSSQGPSYAELIRQAHTERQLSDVYDDLIDSVPLGQRLFGNYNPVQTAGPMQVSVIFAEQHDQGYPWKKDKTVRREVFSRRGSVWFGTLHLLGYPVNYPAMIYRFADYNAGWYASRNAAFQAAVARVTGRHLALDGDLVQYGSDKPGKTELAVLSLQSRLGISAADIHHQLSLGERPEFTQSDVWKGVFRLADQVNGSPMPHARLPGITLESPKITRDLTTAWYADRVNSRFRQCLARQ